MDDREIAKRAVSYQKTARDYPMMELPGYMDWSERKLAEGESPAFIAHLDATSMCLRPEEREAISESDFEEMLADLKAAVGPA